MVPQTKDKEITLIIYDNPKPPQYFKIKKYIVEGLLILIPVIIISSFLISVFSIIYSQNKPISVTVKAHDASEELKAQNDLLKQQLIDSETQISELSQKIANSTTGSNGQTQITSNGSNLADFNLFTPPLGMNDLRAKDLAKTENFSNQVINSKILFKFDLLNNFDESTKLTGYIFVLQYHSYGISIYPNLPIMKGNSLINYNQGESYKVSRFRPVVAEFPMLKNASKVWYKIIIFSSKGDLISIKNSDEYPLN